MTEKQSRFDYKFHDTYDTVPKMLVLDLETTGLRVGEGDRILEVGMVAFNQDFHPISEFQCLVNGFAERRRWNEVRFAAEDGDEDAKIVVDMHERSGLAKAIENGDGNPIGEVQDAMIEWANDVGVAGLPITGSNAKFDRKFLEAFAPTFDEHTMHYRSIDVSSIKEWLRAFFPTSYKETRAKLTPSSSHRAVADCYDTRSELREYTQLLRNSLVF